MAFWNRERRRGEFESVALPHIDELYRTARRMLGDGATAEDAVQETYLRAWRSFRSFESGTNCRAWLFRILVNTVHDLRRKQQREPLDDDSERILASRAANGSWNGGFQDLDVERALSGLTTELRLVVLLADVEGLTYKETAAAMGVPLGTVMSRLSRARAKLREILRPVGRNLELAQERNRGERWTVATTI